MLRCSSGSSVTRHGGRLAVRNDTFRAFGLWAPRAGLEPASFRLTVGCSTLELQGNVPAQWSGLAQTRLRAHDDLLLRAMEHDFAPAHHADLSRLSARVKNKMHGVTDYYQRPARVIAGQLSSSPRSLGQVRLFGAPSLKGAHRGDVSSIRRCG